MDAKSHCWSGTSSLRSAQMDVNSIMQPKGPMRALLIAMR